VVHPIPSHLLHQTLEPDALADQGQLLLGEVATDAHTQLFPEAPDPALGVSKEWLQGFRGSRRPQNPRLAAGLKQGKHTKAVLYSEIRWTDRWAEGHM